MEQSTDRPKAGQTGATPGIGATARASLGAWRDRAVAALRPRQTAPASARNAGAQTTADGKPRLNTGRFFMGLLIFLIAAQLLGYLLAFLNGWLFHCGSAAQVCGMATTIAPPRANVPILSGLQWFLLLYMLMTLGIWYVLYRFNVIPRDPWGVKARNTARAHAASARTRVSTAAVAGRNRAARRAAGTLDSTPVRATTTSRRLEGGAHDAAYERVKAAQRARRRRDAKR
jgi:hypothetical protein